MLSRVTKIEVKDTLLIKGPATLKLQDGEVEAIGMRLTYEEPIIVRRNKIVPLEPITKPAYIIATFGPNGEIVRKQGKCGTKIWIKAAELLSANTPHIRKILVIGASDSGKSTFTTYLTNLAITKGYKVGIVDADIGQSDLAPPGCVSGAILCKQLIDLRDVKGDVIKFVGSTSPMGLEDIVIEAVKDVTKQVEAIHPTLIIVNTDGYIDGEGVRYKLRLIEALSPDQIVYIASEPRSQLKERLVNILSEEKVLTLEGVEGIIKSPSERMERRMSQFYRFLKNGRVQRCNLKDCKVFLLNRQYTLGSAAFGDIGQLEISDIADNTILVSESKLLLPRLALEGMFVGLGANGVKGFGCILSHKGSDSLNVWTPLQTFNTLYLSFIKLNNRISRDERLPFRYLNTYTPHLAKDDA
ncbi:MAG: Clp1/GlmU family protein [Nitrososphaerales archaeon]